MQLIKLNKKGVAPKLFLSYARDDVEFVKELRVRLEQKQYSTWMDIFNLPKGKYWPEEIDKGLKSSDIVVGVISPASVVRRAVLDEWDWALTNRVPLILLLFKPVPKQDISHRYISIQHIDMTQNRELAFEELFRAIESIYETGYTSHAPTKPPINTNTYRADVIERVYSAWIEGVLHESLSDRMSFSPQLQLIPKAVLRNIEYGDCNLPSHTEPLQLFHDMNGELLILGEPGSGKTTFLLKIARELLLKAKQDMDSPVPIVLNLSSWKGNDFKAWYVQEVQILYQLSRRIAYMLLESERIAVLLDGLDEVQGDLRERCISAINDFRKAHTFVEMVITSRSKEYEALNAKLDLRGAVELQPLDQAQIQAFLANTELNTLRQFAAEDRVIEEMASVPFLLNTMSSAYRAVSPISLLLPESTNPKEERLKHLFNRYIEHKFSKALDDGYKPGRIRTFLGYLANSMSRTSDSIFYIESLMPRIMNDTFAKVSVITSFILMGLAVFACLTGIRLLMASSGRIDYLTTLWGYIFAPIIQVVQPVVNLIGQGGITINLFFRYVLPVIAGIVLLLIGLWRKVSLYVFAVSVVGAVAVLIIARAANPDTGNIDNISNSLSNLKEVAELLFLIFTPIVLPVVAFRIRDADVYQMLSISNIRSIRFEIVQNQYLRLFLLALTLFIAVIVYQFLSPAQTWLTITISAVFALALVSSGIYLLVSSAKVNYDLKQNIRPGDGFRKVRRLATFYGMVALLVVLFVAYQLAVFTYLPQEAWMGILLIAGGNFAIIWLLLGGRVVTLHIATRLVLWWYGVMPSNLSHFLEYATRKGVLRRIGNGYMFAHRYIQDYFNTSHAPSKPLWELNSKRNIRMQRIILAVGAPLCFLVAVQISSLWRGAEWIHHSVLSMIYAPVFEQALDRSTLRVNSVKGELPHHPDDGLISERVFHGDYRLFVFEVTFLPPYSAGTADWDCGIIFHDNGAQSLRLSFTSDGNWALKMVVNDQFIELQTGHFLLDTDGRLHIALLSSGDVGLLRINDSYVAQLRFGVNSPAGDIAVATGLFEGNEQADASTGYEGTRLWIPSRSS